MLQSHGGFFWTKTGNFLLFTQAGSSQIFYFLCQKYVPPPPPPQKSSNLHESQELSGTLPQKLKSVKILKTFIHAI